MLLRDSAGEEIMSVPVVLEFKKCDKRDSRTVKDRNGNSSNVVDIYPTGEIVSVFVSSSNAGDLMEWIREKNLLGLFVLFCDKSGEPVDNFVYVLSGAEPYMHKGDTLPEGMLSYASGDFWNFSIVNCALDTGCSRSLEIIKDLWDFDINLAYEYVVEYVQEHGVVEPKF